MRLEPVIAADILRVRHLDRRFALPIAPLLIGLILAACAGPKEVAVPRTKPEQPFSGIAPDDQVAAAQAVQDALETRLSGAAIVWRPGDGTLLEVTPTRTFKIATGHFCRDYRIAVRQAAVTRTAIRTACRTGEGLWLDVNPPADATR